MRPERGDLGVGEYPFTAFRLIALYADAGVDRDDVLPHAPTEDGTGRGKDLIGEHRFFDRRDDRLDISTSDAADIQSGPPWQQVPCDQGFGLPVALVFLAGVLIDVTFGHIGK